jgi:hypothetical protein
MRQPASEPASQYANQNVSQYISSLRWWNEEDKAIVIVSKLISQVVTWKRPCNNRREDSVAQKDWPVVKITSIYVCGLNTVGVIVKHL